ncbi:MAG: phosphoadenosine phosphosulfate reductase family protein [Candidatus Competibacteraceae bacterium]|nr:phosphoadenosine phosphosulfate reductase family protein [Candidatus Competibacteraceae bacterium]
MEHNIISVSGGKDSTALLLLAIERHPDNMQAVFADVGNEHDITYEYVRYLEKATGVKIRWIKADFSQQIERKKAYVIAKWSDKGVPQETITRAVSALVPTGIPFLDLCLWKGRFPSAKAAFCSEELKRNPIIEQVHLPLLEDGNTLYSWQGVRADESRRRAALDELENVGGGLWNYRPILKWTASDCFAMHRKHGIKHNPLYEMGMGRVGCMPCINCRKDELLEISKRFPEAIERIRQWETAVKQASKWGATFFPAPSVDSEWSAKQTIDVVVEWAKTSRGGKQYDFLRVQDNGPICSSLYGLCE